MDTGGDGSAVQVVTAETFQMLQQYFADNPTGEYRFGPAAKRSRIAPGPFQRPAEPAEGEQQSG
eukprot:6336415-Alexandrium_andersonii.AAC.1